MGESCVSLRRGTVLLLVAAAACSNTHVVRIPVEANLADAEEPVRAQVSGVRVAVHRPPVVNDPDRRLDLTNTVAESYPSMSHMAVAVPAALREVGFDVVEVADLTEAEDTGAQLVLDLAAPEVAGFHPAEGDRVALVGSAYDIRVQYRGALKTGDLRPLGVVTGYGQDTTRYKFMEPLFKQAVMGAFIAAATLGASVFSLYLVFQFGLIGALATSGEPFGICPKADGKSSAQARAQSEVCSRAFNYVLSTAFVLGVSFITGLAGSIAGDVGETAANAGLALAYTFRVGPQWRGMVKRAHDQAARDLAAQLAQRALHPYVPPRPSPPVVPAPAPAPPAPVSPS